MSTFEERPSPTIQVPESARRWRRGFSLAEVTVAIAIIASSVLAVVALIPYAVDASREAASETTVSLVMEDVRNQLRGRRVPINATAKFRHGSFYYDQQGQLLHFEPAIDAANFGSPVAADLKAPVATAGRQVVVTEDASFRADVTIVPVGAYDASHVPGGGLAGVVTVILEVYSPINLNNGSAVPAGSAPLRRISFPMSRLTDPGWEMYESGYQPRLEI